MNSTATVTRYENIALTGNKFHSQNFGPSLTLCAEFIVGLRTGINEFIKQVHDTMPINNVSR